MPLQDIVFELDHEVKAAVTILAVVWHEKKALMIHTTNNEIT